MPGGDRTGPMGQGPLSGRGLGSCGGKSRFRCGGSGWRHRQGERLQLSKEEQKKILQSEKEEIEKKLAELEE